MATTRERIEQAEGGVANLQSVLDHTQSALAVAEQVEGAARKSRRLLKFLLALAVLGVVIAVVVKITRSRNDESEQGSSEGFGDRPT